MKTLVRVSGFALLMLAGYLVVSAAGVFLMELDPTVGVNSLLYSIVFFFIANWLLE